MVVSINIHSCQGQDPAPRGGISSCMRLANSNNDMHGKRPHCHQPHCVPTGLAEIWEEGHLDNCTCRKVTADTCSGPAWLYIPSCREGLCHVDAVVANHRRHSASQCISSGLPTQDCCCRPLLVQVLCIFLRRAGHATLDCLQRKLA